MHGHGLMVATSMNFAGKESVIFARATSQQDLREDKRGYWSFALFRTILIVAAPRGLPS